MVLGSCSAAAASSAAVRRRGPPGPGCCASHSVDARAVCGRVRRGWIRRSLPRAIAAATARIRRGGSGRLGRWELTTRSRWAGSAAATLVAAHRPPWIPDDGFASVVDAVWARRLRIAADLDFRLGPKEYSPDAESASSLSPGCGWRVLTCAGGLVLRRPGSRFPLLGGAGRERRDRRRCDAPPADMKQPSPPRRRLHLTTRRMGGEKLARSRYEYCAGRVFGSPSDAAGIASLADPLACSPSCCCRRTARSWRSSSSQSTSTSRISSRWKSWRASTFTSLS